MEQVIEGHVEELELESAVATRPVRITVCAGEMSFAPIAYHTFKVGAVFVSSDVLPDETPETTAARLRELAIKSQRDIFLAQRDLFWKCFEHSKKQAQMAVAN